MILKPFLTHSRAAPRKLKPSHARLIISSALALYARVYDLDESDFDIARFAEPDTPDTGYNGGYDPMTPKNTKTPFSFRFWHVSHAIFGACTLRISRAVQAQ